jgi:hypothetical protein
LQDVAANVGGIVKFLLLVSYYLNYVTNRFEMVKNASDFLETKIKINVESTQTTESKVKSEVSNSQSNSNNLVIINDKSVSNQNLVRNPLNYIRKIPSNDNHKFNEILKRVKSKLKTPNENENLSFLRFFCGFFSCRPNKKFEMISNLNYHFFEKNNVINLHLELLKLKKTLKPGQLTRMNSISWLTSDEVLAYFKTL